MCEQFGVWGEKSFMGKTYDGIHRISFLIDADGKIEHVFNDFKTSNHHDVVLNWLKETRNTSQAALIRGLRGEGVRLAAPDAISPPHCAADRLRLYSASCKASGSVTMCDKIDSAASIPC
ncbi:bacterioferritin comigratory protein [Salmonella enterica subsp. arizonae]|uniref:Bacterioferritin comigratory protein n=1 Tax=Salmonella enterica subsp. arizonae TaxID=59203 RepID=A0A379SM83_SALER|nr:bacterioferritin comigratory protein [Salmonella enterica subsp. arizonae]